MYAVEPDPYCYPDSDVLINLPGLRSAAQLEAFELIATTQRADEAFPAGRFGVSHYRRFHRHLFQDVYAWAGKFRTVRLAKGASMFCYPEHIPAEMDRLFDRLKREDFLRGRSRADFARGLAAWLASINAIHPFREGNGRTQLSLQRCSPRRQVGHSIWIIWIMRRIWRRSSQVLPEMSSVWSVR